MTAGRAQRGTAIAPLVYWLVVITGLLAAHRVLELSEPLRAAVLWVAVVMGTIMGQGAAWRRLRLWVLVLLLPVMIIVTLQIAIVSTIAGWPALPSAGNGDPWLVYELGVMAFVPAVLGGYASMSERGALAAFWFPASIWMVAILDGAHDSAFAGTESLVLLSALAALFVAFLFARETRRIALWQSHAARRLSTPRPGAVLRRSPSRSVAQVAWVASTTAATLVLAAWMAPHLWQSDEVGRHAIFLPLPPGADASGPAGSGVCCPDPQDVDVEGHRLREYLPLLKPHDDVAHAAALAGCVPCNSGVAAGAHPVELTPLTQSAGERADATVAMASQSSVAATGGTAAPSAAPPSEAYAPLPSPPQPPAPPLATAAAATSIGPARAHGVSAPPAAVAQSVDLGPLPWVLALVASGLLVQLAVRPLRRMVTLWHLRESLWPEPVDQRVSNLWQLVLVGLRDAGWRAAPGEQPQQLARRVAVPGAEACATVLERTRHGARVDASDLETMKNAARDVYRASRRRVGRLARGLSWLRWPLV